MAEMYLRVATELVRRLVDVAKLRVTDKHLQDKMLALHVHEGVRVTRHVPVADGVHEKLINGVREHVNVVQMIDHEDVAVLARDRVGLIVLGNVRVIQILGHRNRVDRVHGRVPRKCVAVSSLIASPRLLENVHKAEVRALVRGVHARDILRDESAELGHVYKRRMGLLVIVGGEVVLVRMRQYDVTEVRNVLRVHVGILVLVHGLCDVHEVCHVLQVHDGILVHDREIGFHGVC